MSAIEARHARPHGHAHQRGVTLAELVTALGVTALIVLATITVSLSFLNSERTKGAVYQVQSLMQRARMEAVARNRECRFVIDAAAKTVWLIDSLDGAVLRSERLDEATRFVNPDGGDAITLNSIAANTYDATFSSVGAVTSGAGSIYIEGGDRSRRIDLLVAGAVHVVHRQGGEWVEGP